MENINVKCQTLIKMKGYVFSLLSFFLHLLRRTNETNGSEALITHAVSGAENMSSLFLPMKAADDWERCTSRWGSRARRRVSNSTVTHCLLRAASIHPSGRELEEEEEEECQGETPTGKTLSPSQP